MPQIKKTGFIRIPKALLLNEVYSRLPPAAVLLYGLLLDRLSLSIKNGATWEDSAGSVFVYYTLHEIQTTLHVGHDLATKLLRDLEGVKLITRKKQGLGKPNKIYVQPLPGCDIAAYGIAKKPHRRIRHAQNSDCGYLAANKTEGSNTESTFTDSDAAYAQHWLSFELPEDGQFT